MRTNDLLLKSTNAEELPSLGSLQFFEDDSGEGPMAGSNPTGIFEVAGEGDSDPILVAIIAVANLEGRLLVAFNSVGSSCCAPNLCPLTV